MEDFIKELLNGNQSRTSPQSNQSQKFQNNKDVPPSTRAEVLKTAGTSFNRIFHQILIKLWCREKMPHEWNLSITLRTTEESAC